MKYNFNKLIQSKLKLYLNNIFHYLNLFMYFNIKFVNGIIVNR
jgi:hypothetical protein